MIPIADLVLIVAYSSFVCNSWAICPWCTSPSVHLRGPSLIHSIQAWTGCSISRELEILFRGAAICQQGSRRRVTSHHRRTPRVQREFGTNDVRSRTFSPRNSMLTHRAYTVRPRCFPSRRRCRHMPDKAELLPFLCMMMDCSSSVRQSGMHAWPFMLTTTSAGSHARSTTVRLTASSVLVDSKRRPI